MQRFLQWYHKSTRNKIILFSVIFILALGYLFLHRPLGLIMWYHLNFIEEKEQVVSYEKCGSFKHHYTKYAITANVYIINQDTFKHLVPQTNLYFFSYQELDSKPLSSLCKKALKFVDSKKSK
ncbi:hypothetical protein [Helicobacter typhlonius]|uniref:hypothetical protein n=1 Tax=Helicobacter typhlonius TaxID=76936 RepID=UPI002FE0486D